MWGASHMAREGIPYTNLAMPIDITSDIHV